MIFYLFDSELQTTFTYILRSLLLGKFCKNPISRLSEFVNKNIETVNCFKMFIVENLYNILQSRFYLLIRLKAGFSIWEYLSLVTVTEDSSDNISLKNKSLFYNNPYLGGCD